jgi:hypothetical protein
LKGQPMGSGFGLPSLHPSILILIQSVWHPPHRPQP